ncbi:profilin [Artomyces pyxidatus]|uniref:Profilin n=1 Tax=Artomyces pyxidatus TaxID=48021 RepID=A0ACB8TF91_9AGAM|nr:profilin [Artomyces pyxidatus]
MSWQAYVDTNLVGSGKISKAAIIGRSGGVWASSAGYTLSAEEQRSIISDFGNPEKAQANGFRLAGQKFFTVKADERSIYGKKRADGAVIVITGQAVLIAEYEAPAQVGEATPIVEALADYLIGAGY